LKSFRIPIFGCKCFVFDSLDDAERHLARRGMTDAPEKHVTDAWVYPIGGQIVMAFDRKAITHGLVAHESYHAARAVLTHAGVILHDEDEELCAYLTGFIVDKCQAALLKMGTGDN